MVLDVPTLVFAAGFVAFSGGISLLVYWWHDRGAWPALWWACGNCSVGVGIVLVALHSVLPFYASNIVGPLFLDLAAVFTFIAARIFRRGSINPYGVLACLAVWAAATAITGASAQEQFVAALGAGISAVLYAAAALEFWRGRGEELRGRKPMIAILLSYAIALFMVALQFASATKFALLLPIDWHNLIHFVGLAYALVVTIFLVLMLNDRNEKKYRIAALVDPLTGLLNRRAFMDRAQRVFERRRDDAGPAALLAFDLDRFKLINDTFGHAAGDQVLQVFAKVLTAALRPSDVAARIGGEEFVAVIPGASIEIAVIIASRVCDAFQKAAQFVDGQKIEATVSAGVTTTDQACNVTDVLASADGALYHAKNTGRNRVVIAGRQQADLIACNVVRIA